MPLALECRQNSRIVLSPSLCLECFLPPVVGPRLPIPFQDRNTRPSQPIPGPARLPLYRNYFLTTRVLREAFGNPYHCHARELSFLAGARNTNTVHDRPATQPPCRQSRYMYINVPFFPCPSCCHIHPCPPQGKRRCVIKASSAHLCRAQIAQLAAGLQIGIAGLHHVTLPQLSLTRLQNRLARESESPTPSAETPVQFHPNEHRLQTRNTSTEPAARISQPSMCFHFVLSVMPSPSLSLSQTLRAFPLEQTRHWPVSTSLLFGLPAEITNHKRLLFFPSRYFCLLVVCPCRIPNERLDHYPSLR